jgi:hypothetical protein
MYIRDWDRVAHTNVFEIRRSVCESKNYGRIPHTVLREECHRVTELISEFFFAENVRKKLHCFGLTTQAQRRRVGASANRSGSVLIIAKRHRAATSRWLHRQ